MAAIKIHDGSAAFCRHAGILVQQGRFADATGAVEVQHGEGRFSSQQGHAKQLQFGLAAHKASAPRHNQPVSDTAGMLRSSLLSRHDSSYISSPGILTLLLPQNDSIPWLR